MRSVHGKQGSEQGDAGSLPPTADTAAMIASHAAAAVAAVSSLLASDGSRHGDGADQELLADVTDTDLLSSIAAEGVRRQLSSSLQPPSQAPPTSRTPPGPFAPAGGASLPSGSAQVDRETAEAVSAALANLSAGPPSSDSIPAMQASLAGIDPSIAGMIFQSSVPSSSWGQPSAPVRTEPPIRTSTEMTDVEAALLAAAGIAAATSSTQAGPDYSALARSVRAPQQGLFDSDIFATNSASVVGSVAIPASTAPARTVPSGSKSGDGESVEEQVKLCPYCGKEFSFRSNMLRHVRNIHEKRRDHTCRMCTPERAFATADGLRSHVKAVHEKKRDFACPLCARAFTRKAHLKQHVETVHDRHERALIEQKPPSEAPDDLGLTASLTDRLFQSDQSSTADQTAAALAVAAAAAAAVNPMIHGHSLAEDATDGFL
jgi:predicted RNA-binding Zn-ribbon protein involved in translation (DUF1610 family)